MIMSAGHQWLTPLILATWETEIRFKGSPGEKKFVRHPSSILKKKGFVLCKKQKMGR
jgi:hypothetical protein